jgi:TRAP-type transport system periplasmic protein
MPMTTARLTRILAATALATLVTGAAQAQTTLIYGEPGPNRGSRAAATNWFVEEVNRLSEGDLRIDVQWGGALFGAPAARQSIADGVADMGSIIATYSPRDLAGYTVADLPLVNADPWVGMSATNAIMTTNQALMDNLANQNLVFLGTYTTSAVQVVCKGAPIETVSDIAGRKVRGVGAYGQVFGDLGANMVPMDIYEAYQGFDTGLIDCSQGYAYATLALRQYEVADSITRMEWGQVGALGIFMNKDMFDSLEPEQQDVLKTAAQSMSTEFARILSTENAEAEEQMAAGVDGGRPLTVVTLSDEERQKLVDAGQPYIERWVADTTAAGLPAEEILAEYEALLAQFTAQRDTEGYPWGE